MENLIIAYCVIAFVVMFAARTVDDDESPGLLVLCGIFWPVFAIGWLFASVAARRAHR